MPQRITDQQVAVLEAMLSDPLREWYGLELLERSGLHSGTLYPILHRLVADGWLTRTRESPSERGGPARRMYRLTGEGQRGASAITEKRGRSCLGASSRPVRPKLGELPI